MVWVASSCVLLLERATLSGLPDAFVRVVPENGAAHRLLQERRVLVRPRFPSARSSTAGSRSTTSGCTTLWAKAAGVTVDDAEISSSDLVRMSRRRT